jgi:hypothetical protein
MSVFKKTTEWLSGNKSAVQKIKPPDIPLQPYLDKAYKDAVDAGLLGPQLADEAERKKRHVAISIIAHANSGTSHHYAGVHDDEVHFSASLMKVAAMYAAFSLRFEARELAADGSFANATAFFNALKQKFKVSDAVPAIRNAGVFLEPRYTDILSVTGFGGVGATTVDFAPSFFHSVDEDEALYKDYEAVRVAEGLGVDTHGNLVENAKSLAAFAKVSHMYRMIVPSNNSSAGECIRRLGYAYINVKLMNGGFFDPASTPPKGIWLAGDYAGSTRVEIDSVNDGKSAQATTSRQIARLFSQIRLGDLPGSTAMRGLLEKAHEVDSAWISRSGPHLFDFEGVKVGVANLKPNDPPSLGPDVYSEGLLLKWDLTAEERRDRNVNGQLAVCWQNLRVSALALGLPAIARIIETAFSDFLAQIAV